MTNSNLSRASSPLLLRLSHLSFSASSLASCFTNEQTLCSFWNLRAWRKLRRYRKKTRTEKKRNTEPLREQSVEAGNPCWSYASVRSYCLLCPLKQNQLNESEIDTYLRSAALLMVAPYSDPPLRYAPAALPLAVVFLCLFLLLLLTAGVKLYARLKLRRMSRWWVQCVSIVGVPCGVGGEIGAGW